MPRTARFSDYRAQYPFGSLVQPRVGLVTATHAIPLKLREPEVFSIAAPLGDLSFVKANIQRGMYRSGIGSDVDPERAWIRAVVEAAERYACLIYDENDFTIESAANLGARALNVNGIPRCSDSELCDPRCPVRRADPSKEIRWVEGLSLVHGGKVFVPSIMVHLSMVPWESERFWLQISTGVAAHTDLHLALVAAICECVERDAIAMTWLGRLPLRRIHAIGEGTSIFEAIDRSAIDFACFDATTDLGIPTVLALQMPVAEGDAPVSMSCATAVSLEAAIEKAVREACPLRTILYRPHDYPENVDDFSEVIHGAAFYADGHRPDAFDFLLSEDRPQLKLGIAPSPRLPRADTAEDMLAALLDIFRDRNMEVVAVDLTTAELREAGLWAVRAIIPDLVPLSFVHRARFLGTPRLTSYIESAMGAPFPASSINPNPMPFA